MSDVREVAIAQCPQCGADMSESTQLDKYAYEAAELVVMTRGYDPNDYGWPEFFYCFPCRCVAIDEDDLTYRTEFHQMNKHIDATGEGLWEIRRSSSPDMNGATSTLYTWCEDESVVYLDYTGVEDAFDDIMKDLY